MRGFVALAEAGVAAFSLPTDAAAAEVGSRHRGNRDVPFYVIGRSKVPLVVVLLQLNHSLWVAFGQYFLDINRKPATFPKRLLVFLTSQPKIEAAELLLRRGPVTSLFLKRTSLFSSVDRGG